MRIFYLCGDRGISPDGTKGASIHLRSAAAAWKRLGHDVTLMTRRPPEDASALGVEWHPLEGASSVTAKAHHDGTPDVIVERYSLGHEAGIEAAWMLRRPFGLEMNAPLVDEAALHRGQAREPEDQRVEARLLRDSCLVACVSNPLASFAAAVRGSGDGVEVVWNGHDPAEFRDLDGPAAGPPWTLAFLGHPKPWHGADRLPNLVRTLVDEGLDVKLDVIGGGKGAESIRAAVARAGLEERIRITGPLRHSDAIRRLSSCYLSIAPYRWQSFFYFCPIKLIESMAAGVPVVASDLGDIRSIIGEAGVAVDPRRDASLASAVRELLEDPDRRRELSRRGRERARDTFTWDKSAATFLDHLTSARGRERVQ